MAVGQQNGESAGRVGNQVSRMHLTLTPENTFLMNRMKALHKKKKNTGIFFSIGTGNYLDFLPRYRSSQILN